MNRHYLVRPLCLRGRCNLTLMQRWLVSSLIAFSSAYLLIANSAQADAVTTFTCSFDEFGAGQCMKFVDGVLSMTAGVSGEPDTDPFDPNNGKKPMIYENNQAGGLVVGDILLKEPGTDTLSDIIRFEIPNANKPNNGLLVIYSDGNDSPADVGDLSKLKLQDKTTSFDEAPCNGSKIEVCDGLFNYTPANNEIGFVNAGTTTYNFISDVPEPSTALLLATASLGLLAYGCIRGPRVL